ncbi:MAG TPA: alpha/beta hydrolase [Devosia sp.]|nr:alpha/beta hydrolase [Devosia sp.]
MAKSRFVPADHKSFAALPVQSITVGPAAERMAVHVDGQILPGRTTIVCVPGYQRNMTDYADFLRLLRQSGEDAPVMLVDLKGRGRSSDRLRHRGYLSVNDAADLAEIVRALAIERAIFVGQGYGGQVLMALSALQPGVVAGAVLIDSGPVSDTRGLVRLRGNLDDLEGVRSAAGLRAMLRRMLGTDYPGLSESALDALAERTHFVDKRNRAVPLFDMTLVRLLDAFEFDDVLVAQWPLFDALAHAPLLMMRTQLTQQLRRETFDEMMRRRRDSEAYVIEGQGSPALLDNAEDVQPIAGFLRQVLRGKKAA